MHENQHATSEGHSWTLWSLPLTKYNHSYNSVSIFHMLDTANTLQTSAYHLPASSALLERIIKLKTLGHSLLRESHEPALVTSYSSTNKCLRSRSGCHCNFNLGSLSYITYCFHCSQHLSMHSIFLFIWSQSDMFTESHKWLFWRKTGWICIFPRFLQWFLHLWYNLSFFWTTPDVTFKSFFFLKFICRFVSLDPWKKTLSSPFDRMGSKDPERLNNSLSTWFMNGKPRFKM